MDDDFDLLKVWAAGRDTPEGERAGNTLFARHFPTLNRYFVNKVHEAVLVELIQDTMLACISSAASFRGESSFRTWLLGIARNTLLHHYRKKSRKGDKVDPLRDSVAELLDPEGMSTQLAKRREQTFVLAALRAIPVEFQEVLELRYWEGLSDPECAAVLGMKLGGAKSRVRRAKKAFQAVLENLLAENNVPQPERESITSAMARWVAGIQQNIHAGSQEERELEEDWNRDDGGEGD